MMFIPDWNFIISSLNSPFRIKRDFLKHKTVKTNDKIRRFGVVMTPLSRNDKGKIMQITEFKAILARKLTCARIIKILLHEWSLIAR